LDRSINLLSDAYVKQFLDISSKPFFPRKDIIKIKNV